MIKSNQHRDLGGSDSPILIDPDTSKDGDQFMSDQISTDITSETPAKAKRIRKPRKPAVQIYFSKEQDDRLRKAGKDPAIIHAQLAPKGRSAGPTKKAVVIEMMSRPDGATTSEMAAEMVARGFGDDAQLHKRVAALWIPKCDVAYERSGSRGNYRYKAVTTTK